MPPRLKKLAYSLLFNSMDERTSGLLEIQRSQPPDNSVLSLSSVLQIPLTQIRQLRPLQAIL